MEISNPIASQYVINQGLTSQLNDFGKQLPIKSERFSPRESLGKNKVPATTEDEQRLKSKQERTEQDKNQQATLQSNPNSNSLEDNISTNGQGSQNPTYELIANNPRVLLQGNAQNNLQTNSNLPQAFNPSNNAPAIAQNSEQNPNNLPEPIKRYLENSSLNKLNGNASNIDFMV